MQYKLKINLNCDGVTTWKIKLSRFVSIHANQKLNKKNPKQMEKSYAWTSFQHPKIEFHIYNV